MPSEKQDVEKASSPKTESKNPDSSVTGKSNLKPDWDRLLHYTKNSVDEKPHFMEFRLLQRLNIVEIQYDLAKRTADAVDNKNPPDVERESLRKSLHEYATAIRDYDYVRKMDRSSSEEEIQHWAAFSEAFPELDRGTMIYRTLENDSSIDVLRKSLRIHLPLFLSYDKRERLDRVEGYYIRGEPPNGISTFVDRLARFIIAFISGASLIVPMVVMSLHKSLKKSLITTSVAVLLFAAFASLIQAQNSDIVAATAAYAAVLVVFVGVSSP